MALETYNAKYDGYAIAERLLEGVMFNITVSYDTETKAVGIENVTLVDGHRKYVESLGANGTIEHWCNKIKDELTEGLKHDELYFCDFGKDKEEILKKLGVDN